MISLNQARRFTNHKIFLLLFLCIYTSNFLYHLSQIDRIFCIDLRNRVVGARLISQDRSPYYYKWDPSQPETLFDPIDRCPIKNNMITAPPSILLMMQPIANKSYTIISRYWVIIHYLFFLLIFVPAYWFFKSQRSRVYLSITGIILLFTSQWIESVFMGQSHFFLPAILSVTIACTSIKAKSRYFFVGLLLALLVWIRPNALLLVPFMFCSRKINRWQLFGGFVLGCVCFLVLTFWLRQENYWLDFYRSCKDWVEHYTSGRGYKVCYSLKTIEGRTVILPQQRPVQWEAEISNVFNILFNKTGIRINQTLVTIACASAYLIVLYASYRKRTADIVDLLLAGLVLYWLFEICSPIPKTTYYFVELFLVVYFMAGKFTDLTGSNRLVFLGSLFFLFADFIPGNLTIADILLVISLSQYLFSRHLKTG